METALSYLNVLPNTKSEIRNFAEQILAGVESGDINALELKCRLKWIERLIETIDKPMKEASLSEAAKYGKSFDYKGWKVEVGEMGVKYDYSVCGDPSWNNLDAEIKLLSDEKKKREIFLKAISGHVEVADEQSGEVTKVVAPIKSSTTGLKFMAI